ncbi:MAG TPA: hypothetical protein VFO41_08325, partial [Alphaproteobacteria bacterium]|nr:hypothetical protein [Alphaproteobacteria bacterium]
MELKIKVQLGQLDLRPKVDFFHHLIKARITGLPATRAREMSELFQAVPGHGPGQKADAQVVQPVEDLLRASPGALALRFSVIDLLKRQQGIDRADRRR